MSGATPRRRFAPGTTAADLRAYMEPYVARLGYRFSPDADTVAFTLDAIVSIIDSTGDAFCPCRMMTGDPKEDARSVCPCIYLHADEFAAAGQCWCGLFVRTDAPDDLAPGMEAGVPEGPVEVRVAAAGELRDGEARHVKIGKRDIALFRVDGEHYALSNVCRHAFAPLADGFVDGHTVMCPWHGWRYDVRDGTTDHPDADVKTYPVIVRDGEVFVVV